MPDAAPASAAKTAPLTIEAQRCSGNTVVLYLRGRLVAGQTKVLSDAVCPLLPETKRIVLDLSGLKHTDSMGLGAMVRLYVSAKSAGSSLELMHLSQQIRSILARKGIEDSGHVPAVDRTQHRARVDFVQ